MKPIIVFFYIIIAAIILVQCTSLQPTPGTGPIGTQPAAPTATPSPASLPTLTPLPPTPVAQALPSAIVNVKEWLAKKLGVPVKNISLISYAAVDWPDSCLGINIPGVMCAMHVTPGYKVFLQVKDKTYELHSDKTGQTVLSVDDQLSSPSGRVPLIAWQSAGQPCQQVTVSTGKAIFGCYPNAKNIAISADRAADFLYFTQNFASFSANTPDGKITFSGQGGSAANPDQQRSINVWVRLVFKEVQSGKTDPAWDLAMDYHRHGGIAGFADTVYVYSAGYAMTSTYNNDPAVFKKVYLDKYQLQQLYQWLDTFKPVKYDQSSPANVADGMSIALGLAGAGKKTASDQDIQAMLSFGSSLATR
jgi:hypothetical protein